MAPPAFDAVGHALVGNHSRIGDELLRIYNARAGQPAPADDWVQRAPDGAALVTITADNVALVERDLVALGFRVSASRPDLHFTEGWLPITALPVAESLSLEGLGGIRAIPRPQTNAGAVTAQADFTHEANRVRMVTPGYDGTGVRIGVLSDSVNSKGGLAADVSAGELSTVQIVQDTSGTDEGRAMLQIIHDIAPGAGLAFATAFSSEAGFAANIQKLADSANGNCDIIVDDVRYFLEPFYQHGVIAQAVDAVFAQGKAYFSSAGNQADHAYESTSYSTAVDPSFSGKCYDFDSGPGADTRQRFALSANATINLTLQWDQPFYTTSGVTSDMDLYLLRSDTGVVVASSTANNPAAKTPYEYVSYKNTTGQTAFDLVIMHYSGPNVGRVKWVNFGSGTCTEFDTKSSTVSSHGGVAAGAAVAASPYWNQGAIESFSSTGHLTTLFSPTGAPITPVIEPGPRFSAVDGNNNSFFGVDDNGDFDTYPNFYGTSAAAPTAAAVAALYLQKHPGTTPNALYGAMAATARDIGAPGVDDSAGAGVINAWDLLYGNAPTILAADATLNFSAGLPAYFETNSTMAGRITELDSPDAHSASGHIVFDTQYSSFSLNELTLHLDLAGRNATLTFWEREYDDEDNVMPASFAGSVNADGVALSTDGVNWYRLASLTGSTSTNTYQQLSFDLAASAKANGLSLGSDVRVRIQQYDNLGVTAAPSTDGIAIDDLVVEYWPTVTLSSSATDPTTASLIPVTATFSKPVTGFIATDLTVANASVQDFAGSGSTYTFNLAPAGQGTVSVQLAAGVAVDANGHDNLTSNLLTRLYDTLPPTATITSTPTNPSSAYVQFSFTGTDSGSGIDHYEYKLDGGAFATATSPLYLSNLSLTSHTFQVRSHDKAGNVSPAATYTWIVDTSYQVTNTADSGPGSLRQAILDSNSHIGADTITFQAGLTGTITLTSGQLTITGALSIVGPGANLLTISGNNTVRVISTTAAAKNTAISVSGLTITGGYSGPSGGGGVSVADENVTLADCVITGSSVLLNGFPSGGGISVGSGALTLTNCTVSNNKANQGGGIAVSSGGLVMDNCLVFGNSGGRGGGLLLESLTSASSVVIRNTTISGNTATSTDGGGVYIGASANTGVTLQNSTISGNTSTLNGGGVSFSYGNLTVQNSTITNNTATGGKGGGIYRFQSGAIALESTIVSGNANTAAPDISSGGAVNAKTSAIGSATGFTLTNLGGNLSFGANLKLGPLANNGGAMLTHLPGPGSPVRETGSNPANLITDQRGSGFPRLLGAFVDMGAVESVDTNPIAHLVDPAVTAGGATTCWITVTYVDDIAIDVGSLNTGDVAVTGPGGFSATPAFVSVDLSSNGTPRTAMYAFTPPGGNWGTSDNGTYLVSMTASQVFDTNGNAIPAGSFGTFNVLVPATFVVSNANNAGAGSLRQAILDANALSHTPDTITFDPTFFATAKTIILSSELLVTDSLNILGPGGDKVTIDGGGSARVLNVDGLGVISLQLADVTISGGRLLGSASGAGILVTDDVLNATRVTFANNVASANGGVIYAGTAGGTINVSDCTFKSNTAGVGGAIYAVAGVSTVIRSSTFEGNTASGDGGALQADSGFMLVESCLFTKNVASSSGGAVLVVGTGGAPVFRNSTFSGNSAGLSGGALRLNQNTRLLIANGTITNNTAGNGSGQGGGVFSAGGLATIQLGLESTIISGNNGVQDLYWGVGTVDSANSAIGSFGGVAQQKDLGGNLLFGAALLLGPLANNGGPTLTHAPAPNSPLINKGSNSAGSLFDQRGPGFPRVQNGIPDIGAVEVLISTVVTNDADSGAGSLRQAILSANTLPDADTITFDTDYFNTPRTITLTSGQLPITDSVILDGPGSALVTISGNLASRVFFIDGPGTLDVTMSGVTVARGNAVGGDGGGLLSNENLTLLNCVIADNSANFVGGVAVFAPGQLKMTDCLVAGNFAVYTVGGVYSNSPCSIVHSSVTGNKANEYGGGLIADGGLTLLDSSVVDNSAGITGGGLIVRTGLFMVNSTIAGNIANYDGGGGFLGGQLGSMFVIRNSTISANHANVGGNGGGGLLLGSSAADPFHGTLSIQNSTIVGNSAPFGLGGGILQMFGTGTVTVESSILAENWSPLGADVFSANLFTLKSSAIGSSEGFTWTGSNNLPFGADLKLGPLAKNGGLMLTHALLPGSPCLDAGTNPAGLTADQRGFARVVGAAADIGAVEAFITRPVSIARQGNALTNALSVGWDVLFDHEVFGLSAGNFSLSGPGATGTAITTTSKGSGLYWHVEAATAGDGWLGLNLTNSTGAVDAANNSIGFLPFAGESFTIDKSAPQTSSITRIGAASSNAGTVQWNVSFTEPVAGVTAGNFALINNGLDGSPGITGVSGSGANWVVTASTGTGSGTLGLNLTSATGIADPAGNALAGVPFTGPVFAIDRTPPTVMISASPTLINDYKSGANALTLTATFNEPMDTTVAPVFSFPVEDPTASISYAGGFWKNATEYQASYNVFDLNASLPNIDVRVTGGQDGAGNPAAAITTPNLINLDTLNPLVLTITRLDPSPTNLANVNWSVTFTEAVTGLSVSNFLLFNGGLGGSPAIISVTGSGTTWVVNASTGSGDGQLSWYMLSAAGVADLAGNFVAALPVQGPAYAIDHNTPLVNQVTTNVATITDANTGPTGFVVTVKFNEAMDQSAPPVLSFPFENPAGTLTFGSGSWIDARTYKATYAVTDANLTLANVDVQIAGAKDVVGNPFGTFTVPDLFSIDMKSPTVAALRIGDGTAQRSMVTSLTVTFSELVQLPVNPADAFSLTGKNGAVTLSVDTGPSTATQTIAVLTFSGPATEFGSLKDSRYTLSVFAGQVSDTAGTTLDGNNDGTTGDDYQLVGTPANGLFRLFGDADGSGQVTSSDFLAFRLAFLSPSLAFDYNGNGSVDSSDFLQFRLRFLLSV